MVEGDFKAKDAVWSVMGLSWSVVERELDVPTKEEDDVEAAAFKS